MLEQIQLQTPQTIQPAVSPSGQAQPEVKENQLLSWNISIWDWEVFDLPEQEPKQEAP